MTSDESEASFPEYQLRRKPLGALNALPIMGGKTEGVTIEIRIPAQATSLEILRSVIGRASRIAGFSYDGIEDFAMAVDEAATLLIESRPSDLALTLRGMDAAERLEVWVSAEGQTKALSMAELRDGYRWEVLEALCEEVWWDEAGTVIALAQSAR